MATTPQPEEPMGIGIAAGAAAANAPLAVSQPANPALTVNPTPAAPPAPGSLATPAGGISGPPMPQFRYSDINVMSMAGLTSHITINDGLPLLQANPALKQLIQPSIEKAIQDLMVPVVERSIKVALTTCEQIVKKVFTSGINLFGEFFT